MNRKILLTFSLIVVTCAASFSQTKKEGHLSIEQVYLTANNKQFQLSVLSDKTITQQLGSPDKISTKKWETAGTDKVKTYYYPAGRISTEGGTLAFITINKPGIALKLTDGKKQSASVEVGKPAEVIKKLFPISWSARDKNGVFVNFTDAAGENTGNFLRFTFTGNKIATVEYAIDES